MRKFRWTSSSANVFTCTDRCTHFPFSFGLPIMLDVQGCKGSAILCMHRATEYIKNCILLSLARALSSFHHSRSRSRSISLCIIPTHKHATTQNIHTQKHTYMNLSVSCAYTRVRKHKIADGNKLMIHWRKPSEWASKLHEWVDGSGQVDSVMTLYEIREGEVTIGTGAMSVSLFSNTNNTQLSRPSAVQCIHLHTHVCMCIYVYTRCTYMYTHICTYLCIRIYIHTYKILFVCVCVCTQNTHTQTHTISQQNSKGWTRTCCSKYFAFLRAKARQLYSRWKSRKTSRFNHTRYHHHTHTHNTQTDTHTLSLSLSLPLSPSLSLSL